MHLTYPYILLAAGLMVILSFLATRFFKRFGVPSLLVTLGVGLSFGNGGRYDFDYNYPDLTLHISEVALCIIIFAGGLESNWKRFRPILRQGISLATLGVLFTMFTLAAVAHVALGWPWLPALLLGAAVSSTDAAAVFSILENSNLKLRSGVSEVLELESGTNDPMAYFLTLSLCALMLQGGVGADGNYGTMALDFFRSMALGFGSGWLAGKGMLLFIRKIDLKRGQYPVLLLAGVFIVYAVNTIAGGSALLALYVMGILLGNAPWVQREINLNFFESLSWLMETALFLILGLQVYLFELRAVAWEGVALAIVLIFLARPVGAFLSLSLSKKADWRAKTFFAWVGLRGATPIVFALIPVVYQVPDAHKIFNVAFVIVVVSMLVQGTTVGRMAALTGVKKIEKADPG